MHRTARPVTSYDEELRTLVADMVATMYAANGVGLAACQIGVDLAVFVFDCPDDDGIVHRGVVCNPVRRPAGGQGAQARRQRGGLPVLPGRLRRLRPARLRPGHRPGPRRARTSPTRAAGCSRAACSTRPTTPTARCSATGSTTGRARSCASRWRTRPRTTRSSGRWAPPPGGLGRVDGCGARSPRDRRRALSRGRRLQGGVRGQLDRHGGADPDLALDRDRAVLLADQLAHAGQPEAGAAVVLGQPAADELLEDRRRRRPGRCRARGR